MYSSRLVQLLVVAISIMAIGHAALVDVEVFGRSLNMLEARQNSGTGSTRVPPTTSTSVPPPPTSTPQPSSSSGPGPSSTPGSSSPGSSTGGGPSSTPGPGSQTSSLPSSTPGPSSNTPAPSSTPPPQSEESSGGVTTVTSYTVVESTDSAGSKTSWSTATTYTQPVNQTGGGGSSMSDGVKNIIIGVCVGVGGAIILAVAGLLFWRLRSKKRQQDDQDDLAGTSQFNHGQEKSDHSGSTSGRSPFQSTLESYHAPTQTNTASNF